MKLVKLPHFRSLNLNTSPRKPHENLTCTESSLCLVSKYIRHVRVFLNINQLSLGLKSCLDLMKADILIFLLVFITPNLNFANHDSFCCDFFSGIIDDPLILLKPKNFLYKLFWGQNLY
ncbi:hypothetical protein GQR58_019408 [Nymphon striatum]|nr:hypothetical protein GQR58_019408 [Nymphon striatum]